MDETLGPISRAPSTTTQSTSALPPLEPRNRIQPVSHGRLLPIISAYRKQTDVLRTSAAVLQGDHPDLPPVALSKSDSQKSLGERASPRTDEPVLSVDHAPQIVSSHQLPEGMGPHSGRMDLLTRVSGSPSTEAGSSAGTSSRELEEQTSWGLTRLSASKRRELMAAAAAGLPSDGVESPGEAKTRSLSSGRQRNKEDTGKLLTRSRAFRRRASKSGLADFTGEEVTTPKSRFTAAVSDVGDAARGSRGGGSGSSAGAGASGSTVRQKVGDGATGCERSSSSLSSNPSVSARSGSSGRCHRPSQSSERRVSKSTGRQTRQLQPQSTQDEQMRPPSSDRSGIPSPVSTPWQSEMTGAPPQPPEQINLDNPGLEQRPLAEPSQAQPQQGIEDTALLDGIPPPEAMQHVSVASEAQEAPAFHPEDNARVEPPSLPSPPPPPPSLPLPSVLPSRLCSEAHAAPVPSLQVSPREGAGVTPDFSQDAVPSSESSLRAEPPPQAVPDPAACTSSPPPQVLLSTSTSISRTSVETPFNGATDTTGPVEITTMPAGGVKVLLPDIGIAHANIAADATVSSGGLDQSDTAICRSLDTGKGTEGSFVGQCDAADDLPTPPQPNPATRTKESAAVGNSGRSRAHPATGNMRARTMMLKHLQHQLGGASSMGNSVSAKGRTAKADDVDALPKGRPKASQPIACLSPTRVSEGPDGESGKGDDDPGPAHPEMLMSAGGQLPLLFGGEWEAAVHCVVWRVARAFGFQAFNLNPETRSTCCPQWTPATAFLVTDHINRLLVRNFLPRMTPPPRHNPTAKNNVTATPPPPVPGGTDSWAARRSPSDATTRTGLGLVASAGSRPSSWPSAPGPAESVSLAARPGNPATSTPRLRLAPWPQPSAAAPVNESIATPWVDLYEPPSFNSDSTTSAPATATEAEAAATAVGRPRFALAIYELHNRLFHGYEHGWCPHVGLRPRPLEAECTLEAARWSDRSGLCVLVSELALYFLLYSEAANLRHTPELLWFLFWAANNSPAMSGVWREGMPEMTAGAVRGLRERRVWLRNEMQHDIAAAQQHMWPSEALAAANVPPPEECAVTLPVAMSFLSPRLPSLSPDDLILLADLAAHGDGGFVTDRAVAPLFTFLSHEMDALFDAGVEVAHRLGYDDVNESLCRRDLVYRLLGVLGVSREELQGACVCNAWRAITLLGCPQNAQGREGPPDREREGQVAQDPQQQHQDSSGAEDTTLGADSRFDVQRAANFWSSEAFVKTFRERRSWAAVYRAFYRLYSFQLLLLHAQLATAFAPGQLDVLSGAVVTHVWLAAAERVANWWLSRNPEEPLALRQRNVAGREAARNSQNRRSQSGARGSESGRMPSNGGHGASEGGGVNGGNGDSGSQPPELVRTRRRRVSMEGQPLLGGLVGCADWLLAASIVTLLYGVYWRDPGSSWGQVLHDFLRRRWLQGAAAYGVAVVAHGLLTTRAGYRVSALALLPEQLRRLLSCHSSLPPSDCWMEGRLGMEWRVALMNAAMWVVVLAAKLAFEYYVIAKPIVAPIRALLKRRWLGCAPLLPSHIPCLPADWLLVAIRLLPLALVCLADTTIFYNAVMALLGLLRGLLRLDLGTVASWEELRGAFHRGPVRWWRRCMSADGVAAHRRALRRQLVEDGQDRAAAAAFVPENPQGEEGDDGSSSSIRRSNSNTNTNNSRNHRTGDGSGKDSSDGDAEVGKLWTGTVWSTLGGLRTFTRERRRRQRRQYGPDGEEILQEPVGSEQPRLRGRAGGSAEVSGSDRGEGPQPSELWQQFRRPWSTIPRWVRHSEGGNMRPETQTMTLGRNGRRGGGRASGSDDEGGIHSPTRNSPTRPLGAPELWQRLPRGSPHTRPVNRNQVPSNTVVPLNLPPKSAPKVPLPDSASGMSKNSQGGGSVGGVGGIPARQRILIQGPGPVAESSGAGRGRQRRQQIGGQTGGLAARNSSSGGRRSTSTAPPSPQQMSLPGSPDSTADHARLHPKSPGPTKLPVSIPTSILLSGPSRPAPHLLTRSSQSSLGTLSMDAGSDGLDEGPGIRANRDSIQGQRLWGRERRRMWASSSPGSASPGGSSPSSSNAVAAVGVSGISERDKGGYGRSASAACAGSIAGGDVAGGEGGDGGDGTDGDTEVDPVVALHRTEDMGMSALLTLQSGDLAMWDAFATIWDAIVADLRAADLISDREGGNLAFMHLGTCAARHVLRPLLLPAFFYAGRVQAFVDTGRLGPGGVSGAGAGAGGATATILSELRTLLVWLGYEMGLLSGFQGETVMAISFLAAPADVEHHNCRVKMLKSGKVLVKHLAELSAAADAAAAAAVTQLHKEHVQWQEQQKQQQKHPQKQHYFQHEGSAHDAADTHAPRPVHVWDEGEIAAAAARGSQTVVASHRSAIEGALRGVLEALGGEARALMRGAARARRLQREEQAAAGEALEGVVQQVLADLTAHPDWLPTCLGTLLPSGPANDTTTARTTRFQGGSRKLDNSDGEEGAEDEGEGEECGCIEDIGSKDSSEAAGNPMPRPGAEGGLARAHLPSSATISASTTVLPYRGLSYLPSMYSYSSSSNDAHAASTSTRTSPPTTPTSSSTPSCAQGSYQFRLRRVLPSPLQPSNPSPSASTPITCPRPVVPGPPPPLPTPPDLPADVALRRRVVGVLVKMLTTSAAACQPASPEALRILGFFINSLSNPQLVKPPPLSDMPSWTVLTPCYEEDVLYALQADLAAKQLGLPPPPASGPGRLPDLLSETEDNVSLMAYLRSMFPADWTNFLERLSGMLGGADLSRVTENDFGSQGPLHGLALELQLWATYRGQLLGRTVRGMMCYRRAVSMLVQMEYPRPEGVSPSAYAAWVEQLVDAKFQYVCTCQVYGRNRKASDLKRRWLAESVDTLCLDYPGTLQVAYLDSAVTSYGPTDYSVLIAGNPHHPRALSRAARSTVATTVPTTADTSRPTTPAATNGTRHAAASPGPTPLLKTAFHTPIPSGTTCPAASTTPILELYRVRLPQNRHTSRGVIIGEGKPENQNHAIIFCFGEGLQTIDMNQDNALAEALKVRNLLCELTPEEAPRRLVRAAARPGAATSAAAHAAAVAERTKMEVPVALVGFREWIFSDVSGALGTFAAACEFAFGTIVQRTMSYPGRVRMHYGHPDVFNKLHIMTRGGVSKATRQLHISEDVFGGYNHTLRGAVIKYREYISCGKGRDMGFDSINAFEIKISGGGGECVVSRDVARLAARLDLPRLAHFYHSGLGYFVNSLLIMTAVWMNIWVLVVFALARASAVQLEGSEGSVRIQDTLRAEHLLQLGPLMLMPYAAQLLLESGLLRTVVTLLVQLLAGSVAFAVFRQQTTAYYFNDDITFGGARYISTGRGFSITASSFTTLFSNYSRSHLYPGAELVHLLILYGAVKDCFDCSYAGVTYGTWLVALSLLLSPMWFNPMAFSRDKVRRDWTAWRGWMRGELDSVTGNNWYTWNRQQLEKVRNERGTVTDPALTAATRLVGVLLPRLILAGAAVSRLRVRAASETTEHLPAPRLLVSSPLLYFTAATALIWVLALVGWALQRHFAARGEGWAWRLCRVMICGVVAGALLGYSIFAVHFFRGSAFSNLAMLLYGNIQLVMGLHAALTALAPAHWATCRAAVDSGFWLGDWLLGHLLLALMAVLAWLGFVSRLQTRLLFNSSFAASIRRGKLVRTIGLIKLDEEHRMRDEGQARAALARSVARTFPQQTPATTPVPASSSTPLTPPTRLYPHQQRLVTTSFTHTHPHQQHLAGMAPGRV